MTQGHETPPEAPRRWSRKARIALGCAGFIAVALVAAPCVMDREDRTLDQAARTALRASGHTFLDLERGATHYQLTGPADGHVVVLVHGTSGPMTVWDETVEPLVAAGYRVLRYDTYGRGYSQRIETTYDLDLFVNQLEQVLDATGIRSQVTLVGSSLGAIVCAEMAIRRPERVHSAVFVGPAGFRLEASVLARLSKVRWIGDYLMRVFGDRKLVEHHRKYFVDSGRFASYHRAFAEQLRYRGSKAAILSTLRHAPLQGYVGGYGRFARIGLPSLLVWGVADATFPFANHTVFLDAVPHAELAAIDGAAHLPMLEQPAAVNAAITSFLAAARAP